MFLDNALTLDPFTFNGGTPTTVAAATASANVYDIAGAGYGNPITGVNYGQNAHPSSVFGDDYGIGSYTDAPVILVQVATTFTTASGATGLQIILQEGADNGSNAVSTWVNVATSVTIPIASLTGPSSLTAIGATPGLNIYLPFPPRPPGLALPRFVRLYYQPVGGSATFSAGAVSSAFVLGQKTSLSGSAVANNYVTWNA